MFEVRIHGRGGQGVVTAAEMLSVAAFREGRHAQAFPSFGSERTGAPVVSFCRIDERPIRLREPIANPHAIIVGDPTLFLAIDPFQGMREGAYVLVSSTRDLAALGLEALVQRLPAGHVRVLPAAEIARRHVGKPLPNAALLGAFAAMTGTVSLDAILAAVRERFRGKIGEANAAAAAEAYALIGPAGAANAPRKEAAC
jgi:pyruvate ferredoxin oxidoreductase gamma subunit